MMRAAVWRELAGDGKLRWRAHLIEHDIATEVPESSGPIGAAKRLVELIAIREQAAKATGAEALAQLPLAPPEVAARWQRGIPLLVAGVVLELRLDD
jgi:hypothetical protein